MGIPIQYNYHVQIPIPVKLPTVTKDNRVYYVDRNRRLIYSKNDLSVFEKFDDLESLDDFLDGNLDVIPRLTKF